MRSFPWLRALRKVDLEQIARATGIQTSGTKAIIIPRIEAELASQSASSPISCTNNLKGHDQHVDRAPTKVNGSTHHPNPMKRKSVVNCNANDNQKPLSILSIDMGIKNLAFAHLRVPRRGTDPDSPPNLPVLTAWHRLAVSDLSVLDLEGSKKPKWQPRWRRKPTPEQTDSDEFAPHRQAVIAYDLISNLVDTYRPTHILIERQRFRTGGGTAIPEWTLRVGIFEYMLYGVLETLKMVRGDNLVVEDIDPKRVLRYWLDLSGKFGKDSKIIPTARAAKKAKVDIIGNWISAARHGQSKSSSESVSATGELIPGVSESEKVSLAGSSESPALEEIIDAYLRKFNDLRASSSASLSPGTHPPKDVVRTVDKLDDLADCLLQGLAWVEWQAMKERIAREGPEALGITPKERHTE